MKIFAIILIFITSSVIGVRRIPVRLRFGNIVASSALSYNGLKVTADIEGFATGQVNVNNDGLAGALSLGDIAKINGAVNENGFNANAAVDGTDTIVRIDKDGVNAVAVVGDIAKITGDVNENGLNANAAVDGTDTIVRIDKDGFNAEAVVGDIAKVTGDVNENGFNANAAVDGTDAIVRIDKDGVDIAATLLGTTVL
ncbi:uncharacterized protein LOC119075814 [Bradysia coprophila]|uniref:uncharacterized protein LOC119075814 n=1 Tax=Bradysia coprophila TaxID=38358 RepID=UPI00187D965A|nr:uncharacterized protein LOC119075814 [Bradysia coprophila]